MMKLEPDSVQTPSAAINVSNSLAAVKVEARLSSVSYVAEIAPFHSDGQTEALEQHGIPACIELSSSDEDDEAVKKPETRKCDLRDPSFALHQGDGETAKRIRTELYPHGAGVSEAQIISRTINSFISDCKPEPYSSVCAPSGLGPISHPTSGQAVNNALALCPQSTTMQQAPVAPPPESKSKSQFWHAGDYETGNKPGSRLQGGGMEHVRVHPKFLHSNATSHKWALGALAELLDNAVDEIPHGATFCKVDVVPSPRDGRPMLVIEDNGGGMSPDLLRGCMSLGYSEKSKRANTIGQYGNGFKTSTMRLGADVLVFTRSSPAIHGCATQSVGLLSFTFLRDTGHEDIVVPMLDYDLNSDGFPVARLYGSGDSWKSNLEVITSWTPYTSEEMLLSQFGSMAGQGTRVVVYNLWLTDDDSLELDFESDPKDIQLRGARDERYIKMAESNKYPNSHHFLTYRHSLRSYAAILYLRLPAGFQLYLRGQQVELHSITRDLMHKEEVMYRPKTDDAGGMVASVTIGFVKDAKEHIEVQGFCVYHKNRLIKPFWKLWNTASSQGRGVVGVLEANFVEPAHDKQGFEKTEVLRKLEERLLRAQKAYWQRHAHLVGYVMPGTRRSQPESTPPHPQSTPPPAGRVTSGQSTPTTCSLPFDVKSFAAQQSQPSPPLANRIPASNPDPSCGPSPGTIQRSCASLGMEIVPFGQSGALESIPMDLSYSQQGLQKVVDCDWLSHLMEENKELKQRNSELEALTAVVDDQKKRLDHSQGLVNRLCECVKELQNEREQLMADKRVQTEVHNSTEIFLRDKLQDAMRRAMVAEERLKAHQTGSSDFFNKQQQ